MPLPIWFRALIITVCPVASVVAAGGAVNMIGVQSQNEGMLAVPAKTPPIIDGDLSDWDWSGRIWSFNNIAQRDRYSVETGTMWDADNLYLAFKWHDPSPLGNTVDPRFNPTEGWKGDSVQIRIKTDRPMWITTWHYAPGRENVVLLDVWKDPRNAKAGTVTTMLAGEPGATSLGQGVEMAVKKTADGYVQEIKLPWKVLYQTVPVIAPGLAPKIGFEFLWGAPPGAAGHTELRYADNLQPGTSSREFFWTAQQAWGDVKLSATGGLPVREYRVEATGAGDRHRLRFTLPADARRFTVVIEDEAGRRVRNLLADRDPADFAVKTGGGVRQIEAGWDGCDDFGAAVPAGNYRTRGLWHGGLDAVYDITFDNPGTPPWPTADGTGDWGSNHANPLHVARAGDGMIVSWVFSEGGHATIGLNAVGRKTWGDLRGSDPVAADDRFVYGVETHQMSGGKGDGARFFRLSRTDGTNHPFVLDGKERAFPLPISDILGQTDGSMTVTGMALHDHDLAIALGGGEVVVLDADSAAPRTRWKTGRTFSELAYSGKGELFGIADEGVFRIGADGAKPFPLSGLGKAAALAFDGDGNLLVADTGPDRQVKAFSPDGTPVYTAGKKGGRPARGDHDPQAMASMTSVAADARGSIWVVESTNYPRRVSVWGRDGKLVRDYTGGANYAGTGRYLHDTDPALGYAGPVEWTLDRKTGESHVSRILWKADETRTDEPASFDDTLKPGSYTSARRFRSEASGRAREYLFKAPYYPNVSPLVILMEDEAGWRPVAAVGTVIHFSGRTSGKGGQVVEPPGGDFAGLDPQDGVFWNDLNEDGRVQRSECEIVPVRKDPRGKSQTPLTIRAGWNGAINTQNLTFYVDGVESYTPLRFTKRGAPVYGPASIKDVVDLGRESPYVLPEDGLLVGLRSTPAKNDASPASLAGYDLGTGRMLWHYPNLFPGVHGSHKAPIATPGDIIGPLKITGAADAGGGAGRVFAIRGNLGQDYFLTADGLFVGALFADCRLPAEDMLPPTVDEARGKSLKKLSEGGEPFSGWFGRQADGHVRLSTSIARNACLVVDVKGLETIHRFTGPAVNVEAGKEAAPVSAKEKEIRPAYRITRVTAPPAMTGGDARWSALPAMALAAQGSPEGGEARLAYDDDFLYVRFTIKDASPLKNGGRDYRRLFKTGDAVDLQMGPRTPEARRAPGAGDQRVLLAMLAGKPAAVLMRPVDPQADRGLAHTYDSPVGRRLFERVEVCGDVRVAAAPQEGGYVMTAAIPWKRIGVAPTPGMELRGDAGFISSDRDGTTNVARTYWANHQTGLVNDEPAEAWFNPADWGTLTLE